jgi:hypothetical protein
VLGERRQDAARERDVARLDATPAAAVKACTIGSKEYVANAGASSTFV